MAANLVQLKMFNILVFILIIFFLGIFIFLNFLTNSVELMEFYLNYDIMTKEILLSVYYAHGCRLLWLLTTAKNMDSIIVLQKKCLHILIFAPIKSHVNFLFLSDKSIKFTDVIKMGHQVSISI